MTNEDPWTDLPPVELIGGPTGVLTDRQTALLCAVILHASGRTPRFDPVTDLAAEFAEWLDREPV